MGFSLLLVFLFSFKSVLLFSIFCSKKLSELFSIIPFLSFLYLFLIPFGEEFISVNCRILLKLFKSAFSSLNDLLLSNKK